MNTLAVQVSSTIDQLATQAAQDTGLQKDVILAQWNVEEGLSNVNAWPGYNGAGISPGDSFVDKYSNGRTPGGFDSFATPQDFEKAYSAMLNQDRNYSIVRQAKNQFPNNNKLSGQLEVQALADSPWDANHYAGNTGKKGAILYKSYSEITGSAINDIYNNPLQAAATDTANGVKSSLSNFVFGNWIGDPKNYIQPLVVILGSILVILLLYRIFTR